jgi:HPt (histidine-containing phosphotransfer) domain-containing protein
MVTGSNAFSYGPPFAERTGMPHLLSESIGDLVPSQRPVPSDALQDALDAATVAILRQLAEPGEPDPFPEIARCFLDSAAGLVSRLRHPLDRPSLRAEAHSLRGMSGTIGATGLAALGALLEAEASLDHAGPTTAIVRRVEQEFLRVRDAIHAELGQPPAPVAH